MKRASNFFSVAGLFLATALTVFGSAAFWGNAKPAFLASALVAQAGSTVGMSAGVAPNPYNTAAEQLQAKEAALAQEQDALAAQKQALDNLSSEPPSALSSINPLIIIAVGIFLFVLVGFNFILDLRRDRREKEFEAKILKANG